MYSILERDDEASPITNRLKARSGAIRQPVLWTPVASEGRTGMQIYGPSYLHGSQPISAPHSARMSQSAAPADAAPIQDELNLSDTAQMIDQVRQAPDIRQDRVTALRSQIANGTYETHDKLDVAVNRLLDEIG
jgi:negative regulator of flagellin synthesis FlgM